MKFADMNQSLIVDKFKEFVLDEVTKLKEVFEK